MDITPFFKLMVEEGASDLFFTVGAAPHLKVEGITAPINDSRLNHQQMNDIVKAVLTPEEEREFDEHLELNKAFSVPGVGRFRINIFRQRSEKAMVARYIQATIPPLEDLRLPPILKTIISEVRGLVLVVGSTGSGKSTTLASMLDYRNQTHQGHILTIEDPIEFLHKHKKSLVDQREVGLDTLSYANALKNAMREAPDVILIGEIRDRETMNHAIAYAETGHLCISTLHANNANQSLDRIINFFPEDAKSQILMDLSLNLRAIISLRLIPDLNGTRAPAVEILLNSPYISDLIEKGKVDEIKEVMARSTEQGMQTFDQSLFNLYKKGLISKENAVKYADSKNNISLQIRLSEETNFDLSNDKLSIKPEDDDKFKDF